MLSYAALDSSWTASSVEVPDALGREWRELAVQRDVIEAHAAAELDELFGGLGEVEAQRLLAGPDPLEHPVRQPRTCHRTLLKSAEGRVRRRDP